MSEATLKILAIADVEERSLWSTGVDQRFKDVDLMLAAGDLDADYLEYLVTVINKPLLYVHGNHDEGYVHKAPRGCICVDDAAYVYRGLRVVGLGGSRRYREGTYMYTERQMRRRVRRVSRQVRMLGGFDLLLAHAPALGVGDMDDIPPLAQRVRARHVRGPRAPAVVWLEAVGHQQTHAQGERRAHRPGGGRPGRRVVVRPLMAPDVPGKDGSHVAHGGSRLRALRGRDVHTRKARHQEDGLRRGHGHQQVGAIGTLTAKAWAFLALSGVATGASWICYFKALSMGDVNKVVPIDKTSSVLTILLAIVLFGEVNNLAVKLLGSVAILAGTLLMVQRTGEKSADASAAGHPHNAYLAYAVASAVFAALTSILAKVGIEGVPSNLATAVRTCFVLAMAWIVVGMRGKLPQARLDALNAREFAFICLSGIATGASWLCYYFAIQNGPVSVVVPVDKLSILVSMAFAAVVFHERYTARSLTGLALIATATVAMAVWA